MPIKQWLFCCIWVSKLNQSSQHGINTYSYPAHQPFTPRTVLTLNNLSEKNLLKPIKNNTHVGYRILSLVTQLLHGSIHTLGKKKSLRVHGEYKKYCLQISSAVLLWNIYPIQKNFKNTVYISPCLFTFSIPALTMKKTTQGI